MPQLISVIIPTYNRANLILRAIDSVLNQSYKNFELIIVDDGSTDNTHEVLTPLIQTDKIKYFKRQNCGVSASRNFGVSQSLGNYITFLDSDDEWLPHKLQDQLHYFSHNPEVRIVYGEEIWIRNGIRVNQKAIHKKSGGSIFLACVEQCLIGPSSVMLEKKLFFEMGGFDESFVVCEDYDLWLKISSLMEIGFITHPQIMKHGGHEDQLSTRFVAMDFWRIKAMWAILQSRQLIPEYKDAVIVSMKRRGRILLHGYQKYGNEKDFHEIERILNNLDHL
jgi:glycosyltransferase involved in cell wall biosynthesis